MKQKCDKGKCRNDGDKDGKERGLGFDVYASERFDRLVSVPVSTVGREKIYIFSKVKEETECDEQVGK